MSNTASHFEKIPHERLIDKIRKTLIGAGLVGLALLLKGTIPEVLFLVVFAAGLLLVSGDILRASLPMLKDLVDFVAWAVKKLKAAFRNGAS